MVPLDNITKQIFFKCIKIFDEKSLFIYSSSKCLDYAEKDHFLFFGHGQRYIFYFQKYFYMYHRLSWQFGRKWLRSNFWFQFLDNLRIIFWAQDHRIKFSVVSKDSLLSCFLKRDYKLWPNYLPFSRESKKHFIIFDTQKKFQCFFGKF